MIAKPPKGENWWELLQRSEEEAYVPKRAKGKALPPLPPALVPPPAVDTAQFPFHRTWYHRLKNGVKERRQNELYDHQLRNVERYKRQVQDGQGLLICDEPGLGKTASAVACASQFNQSPEQPFSVLIVCGKSNIIDPWVDTLEQWTTYGLMDSASKGKQRKHINAFGANTDKHLANLSTWNIIGYDRLKTVIDDNNRKSLFLEHSFNCVIVDELHTLKNDESGKAQALLTVINAMREKVPSFGLIGLTGDFLFFISACVLPAPPSHPPPHPPPHPRGKSGVGYPT